MKVSVLILFTVFFTKLCSQDVVQIGRYLDSAYNASPFSANIHWGGHPGNQHIIYRMLDEKVTFIYLSNFENEVNIKLINGIIAMLERGK